MSTDRELLELAAKAAGIEIYGWDKSGAACIDPVEYYPWNPLESYSDAARLAHGLSIPVAASEIRLGNGVITSGYIDTHYVRENYSGGIAEKRVAYCRAVVCAAAEIGRLM